MQGVKLQETYISPYEYYSDNVLPYVNWDDVWEMCEKDHPNDKIYDLTPTLQQDSVTRYIYNEDYGFLFYMLSILSSEGIHLIC